MQQAIQKIDHVAIVVRRENIASYVDKISRVLGVAFDEPTVVESTGVIAALSWDSGLELLAPLKEEGRYWERLQKFGEGSCIIVFGVADMDEAKDRARQQGFEPGLEVILGGREPWFDRFKVFREARLSLFGDEMASSIALSQIEPLY